MQVRILSGFLHIDNQHIDNLKWAQICCAYSPCSVDHNPMLRFQNCYFCCELFLHINSLIVDMQRKVGSNTYFDFLVVPNMHLLFP